MKTGKTRNSRSTKSPDRLVLYCLMRVKSDNDGSVRFLLLQKATGMTFPPTKLRPGEDLYAALVRPLQEDLGLPSGSYFPEEELPMIANEVQGPRYEGLPERWYLYPVDISLTGEAVRHLESHSDKIVWWTLEEVMHHVKEPNVQAIASHLCELRPDYLTQVHPRPSMDALASRWAAINHGGVRVARDEEIKAILSAGSRAFNLRVADPYLPYQKQGLGFTWSFFTPKDKQDLHVHGLPAVEIYGVIEGELQLWYKPMNQRGVRMWQCVVLREGDWAEVEPLNCHLACWTTPEGLGTVIKAAATGELAGVGKLGVSGKTTCQHCSVHSQCALHPKMEELIHQYSLPYEDRDYARISSIVESCDVP